MNISFLTIIDFLNSNNYNAPTTQNQVVDLKTYSTLKKEFYNCYLENCLKELRNKKETFIYCFDSDFSFTEEVKGQFDFVVTRAVARIDKFIPWVKGKLKPEGFNDLKNGILFLKGGDLAEEIEGSGKKVEIFPLSNYFKEEFFETKVVVYTRVKK